MSDLNIKLAHLICEHSTACNHLVGAWLSVNFDKPSLKEINACRDAASHTAAALAKFVMEHRADIAIVEPIAVNEAAAKPDGDGD